jgi:uncharacterized protein YjbI with pentapeptide repeats
MVDRPPQPADDNTAKAQKRRRLIWRLAVAGPLVLGLLVILLLACVLWVPKRLYPPLTDKALKDVRTEQNELDAARIQEFKDARLKLQNDARTTLLQGLGALLLLTGAGIGAAVTLRQVRVSQEGLHATREQMQNTLETTRQQLNLTERGQVADRYTTAVEQLGHEKAPVRLGALYSLGHLAQDNPQYRQTVVDVVCAYLRMPYTLPAQPEVDAEDVEKSALPASDRDRTSHSAPDLGPAREELQVRQTAQRLLADHLRCPPQTSGQEAQLLEPSPQQAFWPGIRLDLTGATLVDFTFPHTSVIQAVFFGATFQGRAGFVGATFRATGFDRATFQGFAEFVEATFLGRAGFVGATFRGDARFTGAAFQGFAWFGEATFRGDVEFDRATFQGGHARFTRATFRGATRFSEATFRSRAVFDGATFQGGASFTGATFRATGFDEATFQGDAWFGDATFRDDAWFGKATFQRRAMFRGAHVLHLDNPNVRRVWPDGWTVRPDPTDPSRGTLVRSEYAKEPKPAAPPSDQADKR